MGMLLREDDVHIPGFINLFNARFAPVQQAKSTPGLPPPGMWGSPTPENQPGEWLFGGIAEMASLQREFQVFRVGRPFWQSAALLGLGGFANNGAKNRWLALLKWLARCDSDKPGENGDQRIVNALVANLAKQQPLPCFMQAHDLRDVGSHRVIVRENDTPLFYVEQPFVTISVPMAPQSWSPDSPAQGSPPPASPPPASPSPGSAAAPRKRASSRSPGAAASPTPAAAPRKRPRGTPRSGQ